ncbi:hypothetical protein HPB51_017591 [Rhipicephalus microplus]|uniref:2-oxoisovalerate dehydrogenase subunit alpha n=1 Tax=Rhipicephalus microplus TaxID=6941 RepID=A0A9J6E387_RHIMP|nr:hypothetical protein HPB51_017591 [Rhipicephalus microplus]
MYGRIAAAVRLGFLRPTMPHRALAAVGARSLVTKAETGHYQPPVLSTHRMPTTSKLEFVPANAFDGIPMYSILNKSGRLADGVEEPQLDKDLLVRMYSKMVQMNIIDQIMYESQRQGRISFYMTHYGEEGVLMGSAAALDDKDLVFVQYREYGVLLWRNFSVNQTMQQCYSTMHDYGKGRQMPIHYGSTEHHFVTVSSTLATQMPQAVGTAYAYKLAQKKQCVACYFGDGAASEGDAHASFNFAGVLGTPIIFICRNNGYAISTPTHEQYSCDGIAARGPSYGLTTVRVDGQDVLAMYTAVQEARRFVMEQQKPVLIEAMTYRWRHHHTVTVPYRSHLHAVAFGIAAQCIFICTTSSALRSDSVCVHANKSEQAEAPQKSIYAGTSGCSFLLPQLITWSSCAVWPVLQNVKEVEKVLKPPVSDLFTDVYKDMPAHLRDQMTYMLNHVQQYKEGYPVDLYAKEES